MLTIYRNSRSPVKIGHQGSCADLAKHAVEKRRNSLTLQTRDVNDEDEDEDIPFAALSA